MSDATDVLQAIDQLRRDLSGYHGQLKAHDDLQRHCERQKEQLAALQAAHKPIKDERDLYKRQADRLAAENAKLREERHEYQVTIDSLVCECADHKAENAKLREQVAQRTARRVVTSDEGTDCATGHCECGACGGAVDLFDAYCRHCGARLEDE